MFKIGKYSTTYTITAGLLIALLGSVSIYMEFLELHSRFLGTIFALLFFWMILNSASRVWFWSGFFISILWFWWILVSFVHYHMIWIIPVGLPLLGLLYGSIFWMIAYIDERFFASSSIFMALGLLGFSYIHPFGFDWFKPELILVHTYLGVQKWQLGLMLVVMLLSKKFQKIYILLFVALAYSHAQTQLQYASKSDNIYTATTMTTVADKWNPKLVPSHVSNIFVQIDKAISMSKSMIVLPESVLPFFLNLTPNVLDKLLDKSRHITIIIGALYLEGKTHRNSTYVMQDGHYGVANKVVMVPFGESNPLPSWTDGWINELFFDGAIDYIASSEPTDFEVDGITYRNAICYEATSEILYQGAPKHMVVLSNNGWFVPSIEPTLQRILLEYYALKYGTTIYHASNMSPSYTIKRRLD